MYSQVSQSSRFNVVNTARIYFSATVIFYLMVSCGHPPPAEHYGFLTRLGNDTIALENITREGNTVTIDAVDRFPRVRHRHTIIELDTDGSIRHLSMDIHTPTESANQRERKVVADVTKD